MFILNNFSGRLPNNRNKGNLMNELQFPYDKIKLVLKR